MKNRHNPTRFSAVILSLCTFISIAGCGGNAKQTPEGDLQSAGSSDLKTPLEPQKLERAKSPASESQNPKSTNIEAAAAGETISLNGAAVSPKQATLSTKFPVKIVSVLVKDGDLVKTGQLLIAFEESDFIAGVKSAESALELAKSQVKKAQSGRNALRVKADSDIHSAERGIDFAQQKLAQAKLGKKAIEDDQQADLIISKEGVQKAEVALVHATKTLHDLEELSTVGGVSRATLEDSRTQVKTLESDLRTAKSQVSRIESGANGVSNRIVNAQSEVEAANLIVTQSKESLRFAKEGKRQTLITAEVDIQLALAGVHQAEVALRNAQAARAQSKLTSPISGIIASLNARIGETAQPGATLLSVLSPNDLRIEALVSARLLPLVTVGKRAVCRADTLPGKSFIATASEIAKTAEPDGRLFRVKFTLSNPPALRPGQTVRMTLKSVEVRD